MITLSPEDAAWGRVVYLIMLAVLAVLLVLGIANDAH